MEKGWSTTFPVLYMQNRVILIVVDQIYMINHKPLKPIMSGLKSYF